MVKLTWGTLLRIGIRSLAIQAGFSPEAMQSLGLVFVLAPAWPKLFPDESRHQEAVKRHLTPFNTHPYVAAAMIGGILYYEERIARGESTAEDVQRFKQNLMGPLAALGDGFYWLSLRPATGALALLLVPLLGPSSALVFLVAYNVIHLVTRSWLFVQGYRTGPGVVARLAALQIPVWSARLRIFAALCVGAIGLWFGWKLSHIGGHPWWAGIFCLAVGTATVIALRWKATPLSVMYGAAAAAATAGALS